MPKLIERMQDYVFPIANLAAGANLKGQVVLQTNAPFCLRSLAMTTESGDITLASMRFADERGEWRQNVPVYLGGNLGNGLAGYIPANGKLGMPKPVYPQIIYPADGGVIQVDLTNNDVAAIVNGKIYFRGVSLFEEGAIWSPECPPCYTDRTYDYAFTFAITATQTLLNRVLQFENDGDFAIRGANVTSDLTPGLASYANLYARMRDQEGHYYQADFVHVDVLFSRDVPERPAIWYPEIYMPRNAQLFMDLQRNDPAAASATAQFLLQGPKVYGQ